MPVIDTWLRAAQNNENMLIAWNQLGTDTTPRILCQCMYDESWAGDEGWVITLGFTGWRSHKEYLAHQSNNI